MSLSIVPISEIPKAGETPTDNLMSLYKTYLEMAELAEKEDGVGLAAVQVGIPWNMFVCKPPGYTAWGCFVNCKYSGNRTVSPEHKTIVPKPFKEKVAQYPVHFGGSRESQEGCLSLRDKYGRLQHYKLQRYIYVHVVGKRLLAGDEKPFLEDVDQIFDGVESIVFQHEIDHASGILISSLGKKIMVY